jgi:hypothetical protein
VVAGRLIRVLIARITDLMIVIGVYRMVAVAADLFMPVLVPPLLFPASPPQACRSVLGLMEQRDWRYFERFLKYGSARH